MQENRLWQPITYSKSARPTADLQRPKKVALTREASEAVGAQLEAVDLDLNKLSKAFKDLMVFGKFLKSITSKILEDDDIKPELQEKIDYFYSPYEKQDKGGVPITFNFEDPTDDYLNNSKTHVQFSEISKQNWKEVSKQVLNSKGKEFRKLLKAVNGKLFCDLRKIARSTVEKPARRDPSIGINLFKKALA